MSVYRTTLSGEVACLLKWLGARLCINSMLSERYLGRLVCHTGYAYSITNITDLIDQCMLYTISTAFPFTIHSTCIFHVKSLDKVTPRKLIKNKRFRQLDIVTDNAYEIELNLVTN